MKIDLKSLLIISLGYIVVLFLVAFFSNRIYKKNRKFIYNPYVYALSLGVYCTSWTYYGSVGRASTNGIEFLAIYVGPTLIVFSWWFLLRKIIVITERYNINNIADFLSFRYGRSTRVGVIVTILNIFGIIPYISLQLKAITESFTIVLGHYVEYELPIFSDSAFYISIFMGILAAAFGIHHIGENRKHPALVGVITFESIVKLIIFLIAGVYILKFTNGISGLFEYLSSNRDIESVRRIITLGNGGNSYGKWFAMLIMSMFAVMFLPRQFQMAVVENDSLKHLKSAMYLFPFYLFLINLFVIPIALAGKIYLVSDYNSDYTILYILRKDGSNFLLILTYIGGIAAATGMIIVASVSLTNMFINNIVINLFIKYFVKKSIGKFIVLLKRITIILMIMFGYFFYHFIGEKINLVDIGLTSFAAISQLGPAMILGLFVKRIPKGAVFYGILAGLLVWFYSLIIPYLANAGVISATILKDGLFNLSILKPTALFGLEGLEPWSHTLFWSMFFNLFFIVLFTLVKDQNEEEKETAALCVDSLGLHFLIGRYDKTSRMSLKDVENILTNFFGYEFAKKMINKFLEDIGKSKNELDSSDINMMVQKAKDVLSQAVGPSASEIIINSYIDMTSKGERNVLNIFKDLVTLGVGESRDTLIHRITEMNLLLEISKQFATTSDLIQKLKRTLDMIRENLRFSLIVLRRKRGDVLETIVYSGDIKSFRMISNIRKIDEKNTYIGRAVVNKTPFYINDIDTATDSVYIGELKSKGIKSFCHIPLIIDNEIEGVVSFFSKNYKNMFTQDFIRLLESISNQIGFLINNHNKNEELIKIKEVSKELEIAKLIQSNLVSIENIHFNGIEVESAYLPSVYVGGDYYDIIPIDDNTVDIVIADVSGHNVASALIMTQVRSIIRTTVVIKPEVTPKGILKIINKEMFDQISKHNFIITVLYMRLNNKSGEIIYCNAGHYSPIIIRDGDVIDEQNGDLLLGVLEDYQYREFKLKLYKDDTMILYTDGIIEAENDKGEFYGKERFLNLLKAHAYMDPTKIKNAILTSISDFTKNNIQSDDISIVIIKKV